MKRFLNELRIIAFLAVALPTAGMILSVGMWWQTDSRVVVAIYLLAVMILFVIGVMASLRDEMSSKGETEDGRR